GAGPYSPCASSEQLGRRGSEWRCPTTRDETNVAGLPDAEASHNSTAHGIAQRCCQQFRRPRLNVHPGVGDPRVATILATRSRQWRTSITIPSATISFGYRHTWISSTSRVG